MIDIAINQVWRDRDKRMSGGRRLVGVTNVDGGTHAVCKPVYQDGSGAFVDHSGNKRTAISLRTLRTRFELVSP